VIYVVVFCLSGVIVVLAGTALARYADIIGEATGLGRLWIGTTLLCAATSLPELTTDIAAVRLGAADLAAGDLFGSSMANMLILALIDLLPPRGQVFRLAAFDHALAACLAISLNALAAAFVLTRPALTTLGVGPGSIALLVIYLVGSRVIFRQARHSSSAASVSAGPVATAAAPLSLRCALAGFGVATVAILIAAPPFAWAAKGIAELTGLGTTFVGTWLVGFSTSLPELVSSVAAVRLGAFDLAVGNLFGSNAFNMAIFFGLDLAQPGSIFATLDPNHAVSGLFAVILTSLGLAAIVYRAERRFVMLEPDSLLMVVTYVLGVWLLYASAVQHH
jgi:cation:H+ antiporter